MSDRLSRRTVLHRALAGGAALSFGPATLGAAGKQSRASAAVAASRVEPLVRLLETTPRDQVLEEVGKKIQDGAGYRDVLAALLLAGVREVQPRPSVGYKFHAVLATISYHLIGKGLTQGDRWLPLFWGIDYFKAAQTSDAAQGDWRLGDVDESALPSAAKSSDALLDAMHRWDEPAADVAAAAVARHLEPQAAFELFYPLGARDFRSIGHKAIYVMCAQRTLELIGWEYAEPVLRSLAYALLMHEGGNPAERDDPADRPWRRNEGIVGKIRDGWSDGKIDSEATGELLAVLRTGSYEDATEATIERLNHGVSPASVWDALFCGAAELQLRNPNIVSLHAATTTRAIHHAFRTTASEETRKLLLLQNAAILTMFRESAEQRGRLRDAPVEELEPETMKGSAESAMETICEGLNGQRRETAPKILGYLQSGHPAEPLVARIRELVAIKGSGAHDFKFTSAALESFEHVSEPWRGRYLACGAMHFSGPGRRDNAVVRRTRAALQG